ncbi:MAG: cytochrome c [Nitrospirales bacterium]|nr:c-type cytochrome [Nitrospira sp.]MDR4502523.1 cytochrome c [Nitrospirales bacterium]
MTNIIRGIIIAIGFFNGLGGTAFAEDSGERLVQSTCTACHRIEGTPTARRNKLAPDLTWAGNKYNQAWLVRWLQNPKQKLYPLGYDSNPKRKNPHLALSADKAQAVAQYLSKLTDPRIAQGKVKPGTAEQISRGKQLYQEHACANCHWTPAKNRRGYTGGKSSTSLLAMGSRLKGDWVYRFNLNPDDFVPDSGAYIPKPPLPEEDIYAITAYMMTFQ